MEFQGISKLDLKRRNRMHILSVIKEHGPISRVDIASTLKITRAAVTIITNEMIEEGVLYEVGEAPIVQENLQKGRRKILIDINPNFKFSLGVAIDEDFISIGLSNINGEVLDKDYISISSSTTAEEIISYIVNGSKKMIQNSCLDRSKILGLGIGVIPEICSKMKIYYKDGRLDFTSFAQKIESELEISVSCLNLVSALALVNQGSDYQDNFGNYIFLKMGKNFHMSILLENEIMHEYVEHTNSVEKIIVNPGGRKVEGYPEGSVKAELTEPAIEEKYREIFSKEKTPVLWEIASGNAENITWKAIAVAASKGDQGVLEIMSGVLRCLSVLINNLSNAFFAKNIVLHGFYIDEWINEHIKNYISVHYGDELAKKTKLSNTEGKLEFRGGCAVSILNDFFLKGGMNE
ncbi:MAG: ROK family protein [Porcipelethomonas sp.]